MAIAKIRFRKSMLAAAAMVAVGAAPTQDAQAGLSCTWVPGSGNWGTAGDWSCGQVPTGPNQDSASIGSGKTVTVNTAQSIFTLNNAGTINIDAFLLTLQGGGSTINSGTINIGGPSTAALQMSNDVNNAGGVINIGNGSVLNQFSSAITGGTINSSGSGALVAFNNGSSILSGVTLNGTLDMTTNGSSRERVVGGAVFNGAVNIGNGGILSLDSTGTPNQTISGTGSINLLDAGARLALEGTGATTIAAGLTIHGQGNIGQALFATGNNVLTSNGLISADVSGGTLAIVAPGNGGSFTNAATLQAIGGGTLQLSTNIANAGGVIKALNGSAVVQSGISITGGSIVTSGSGALQANNSGNNFLDGATLTGTLDLTSLGNVRERIANGITINGAVNIANGGILSLDTGATAGGNQTIGGSVTINLNDASARLALEGTGNTTLGSGVTVRGQGNIGQALFATGNNVLTSNGLISADVAGGTLNLVAPANGGSFINNGTLQAINGGTLLLSTNITANAGSQLISGTGSTVVQNGISINGTFTSTGNGAFTVTNSGDNFLDGIHFIGVLDLGANANSRERIINGATINGAINIANGGILSLDGASTTGGNQAIGGTVTINLNDAGARLALEGTGSTTLGSGVTVRGQGNIGQALFASGNNALTNNGLISADVVGGTLNVVQPANGGTFVNNGTLQAINGATLLLSTNITNNAGSQIIAGAGSVVEQNGVTLNGVLSSTGSGVFTVTNSGNNFLDGVQFTGPLDLGTLANSRERIINGATFNGAINIANGGILSLDSATTPGGNQTIGGNVSINLNDAGARLALEGTGTTTLASGVIVHGQGNVGQALFATGNNVLVNNGLISADVAGGTLNLFPPANGGSVVNASTLQATGGGILQISTNVDNTAGLILAKAGSTVQQNGVTITGGTLATNGTGAIQVTNSGNNFLSGVALTGTLDMTGSANSRERIVNGATVNGAINIGNGGILSLDGTVSAIQTIGGSGTINLNDAGARLSVEGGGTTTLGANLTVRGQGNIGQAFFATGNNTLIANGTIIADGGTLALVTPANGGTLAGTGTLQVSGGALNLGMAGPSTQGRLIIGAAGSTLNLNDQNLTLTNDYTNAQSGSGNAFDRRAGVSGTGLILAGGNASQVITGTNVTNGATANATLTLGNVRVGTTTYDYQIANAGSTGPSLRGAIQTNVNGANLTDSRLSGAGVTASNYNTGAPGSSTGSLAVTFTAANAGALTPLSGQSINLHSNFDNIADQKLNIVFGSGASAYNAAIGSAASPVQVANQRIGGANTAAVTVANTALPGSFSEDLNASVGGASGMASGSGLISGRLAGTNNTGSGAINVGVDTTAAGARTGTVTLNYQTAGTVNGVSNGLGSASAGSQAVTVNGNVYQAATGAIQTAALNFGTVQVGQAVTQNLVVRNTAIGAAGFVEDLNASFGAASGTGASLISGSGSLSGILAGSNSNAGNGTMTVTVNTSAAGTVNGGIAVNYTTAGAVAGVSNGLGTASAGSQSYGVAGTIQTSVNVINQASPLVNNPSINFGAMRVGAAAPTANVSLSNVATIAPQAALDASIASNGAPVTASGAVNLLAPGSTTTNQLQVGLSTATAGNFTGANAGSATLSLVSDASNVGNCAPNCQLALASQQVSVSGKVYAPAVAQVNTTVVDFGIVHKGDVVAAKNVSVTNSALMQGLNDTLVGSFGSATGPFTATGTLAGVAAQGTNTTSFAAGLNTGTAGIYTGSATAAFQSHDADLADASLGSTAVTLKGQVNNYAQASLLKTAGPVAITQSGNVYTIDFGNLLLGAADLTETFAVLNGASGPADALRGAFDTSGAGPGFALAGFASFSGLLAGDSQGGFSITFDSADAGLFSDTITLHASGSNGSGYDAALTDTTLIFRGDVVSTAPVPEPETYALLFTGLLLLGGVARSRRQPGRSRLAV